VLRGSLCPDGAAIKQSAVSPELLKHRGRALVFDRIEDYNVARKSEDLPVDEITVLVLRNAGPEGYPGRPEVGNLPLPRKLLERGITDMARVGDARMSGTALAQQDPQVVSGGGTQAGVELAVGRPRRSAGRWCRPARPRRA
jgi:dihydroxyacid dehydratase/phosphogluconate dehydratase